MKVESYERTDRVTCACRFRENDPNFETSNPIVRVYNFIHGNGCKLKNKKGHGEEGWGRGNERKNTYKWNREYDTSLRHDKLLYPVCIILI